MKELKKMIENKKIKNVDDVLNYIKKYNKKMDRKRALYSDVHEALKVLGE